MTAASEKQKRKPLYKDFLSKVPLTQLITNQVYLDFKKLYDLKPVLEQAGLYPITANNQSQAPL